MAGEGEGCLDVGLLARRLAAAIASPLPGGRAYSAGDSWGDISGGGGFTMAVSAAVVSDSGKLFTWGSADDMGQRYWSSAYFWMGPVWTGDTDDELTPLCVSSLLGVKMRGIAAGSSHTLCTSADGDFWRLSNQFGQLGTGSDQAEIMRRYSVGDGTNMASSAWVMLSTGVHHPMFKKFVKAGFSVHHS